MVRPRRAPLLLLAVLGACAAPSPAPWAPPALTLSFDHHEGPLLGGSRAAANVLAVDADPTHALELHAVVTPSEHLSETWPRLASSARLIVTDGGDRSLSGSASLLDGALLADPGDDRLPFELAAAPRDGLVFATTALLPNTTAALDVGLPDGVSALRELRLLVSRGDVLTVALVVRGEAAPGEEDEDAAAGPAERRELIVLQPPLSADGLPLILAVPLPQPGHPRAGLVLNLKTNAPEPGDDGVAALRWAAHSAAVERAADDIRRAAQESRAAASELTADESFLRQVVSAFTALGDAASRRSALSFLAGSTDAPLCGDLALLADADTLAELAARIEEGGRDLASLVEQGGGLGWLLERSSFALLVSRATEAPLPGELQAELLRHAGEAGRYPATLQEALAVCGSIPALRARLVQENRIFLEDATTAARVRACEWLATRGLRPAGFDPLAPLAERRAALARAEAAAAAGAR